MGRKKGDPLNLWPLLPNCWYLFGSEPCVTPGFPSRLATFPCGSSTTPERATSTRHHLTVAVSHSCVSLCAISPRLTSSARKVAGRRSLPIFSSKSKLEWGGILHLPFRAGPSSAPDNAIDLSRLRPPSRTLESLPPPNVPPQIARRLEPATTSLRRTPTVIPSSTPHQHVQRLLGLPYLCVWADGFSGSQRHIDIIRLSTRPAHALDCALQCSADN